MDRSQVAHDLAVAYVERCLQVEDFCSNDGALNANARTVVFNKILDIYKAAFDHFTKSLQ